MSTPAGPSALRSRAAYQALEDHHKRIGTVHLRQLFADDPERGTRMNVEAVAEAARGGEKPSGYLDTGVKLIAGDAVDGVESEGEAFGVRNCWGD